MAEPETPMGEAELEIMVLGQLEDLPLFALEISHAKSLADKPVTDVMARCLAARWAVVDRPGTRPRLSGAGAGQLDLVRG